MTTLNIAIDTCMLTDGERYTLREELAALERDAKAFRCISPIDAEEFAQLQTLLMRLDLTNRSGGLAARAFAAIIALHRDAERYRELRTHNTKVTHGALFVQNYHWPDGFFPELRVVSGEALDALIDARLTRTK